MARHKGVVDALLRLGEARQPPQLPQGAEQLPPAGEGLVDVALVPHVEHQSVTPRIVNPVEGHGQLDGSQIRGQMPPRAGDALHQKLPQLRAQPLQRAAVQPLDVRRGGNML